MMEKPFSDRNLRLCPKEAEKPTFPVNNAIKTEEEFRLIREQIRQLLSAQAIQNLPIFAKFCPQFLPESAPQNAGNVQKSTSCIDSGEKRNQERRETQNHENFSNESDQNSEIKSGKFDVSRLCDMPNLVANSIKIRDSTRTEHVSKLRELTERMFPANQNPRPDVWTNEKMAERTSIEKKSVADDQISKIPSNNSTFSNVQSFENKKKIEKGRKRKLEDNRGHVENNSTEFDGYRDQKNLSKFHLTKSDIISVNNQVVTNIFTEGAKRNSFNNASLKERQPLFSDPLLSDIMQRSGAAGLTSPKMVPRRVSSDLYPQNELRPTNSTPEKMIKPSIPESYASLAKTNYILQDLQLKYREMLSRISPNNFTPPPLGGMRDPNLMTSWMQSNDVACSPEAPLGKAPIFLQDFVIQKYQQKIQRYFPPYFPIGSFPPMFLPHGKMSQNDLLSPVLCPPGFIFHPPRTTMHPPTPHTPAKFAFPPTPNPFEDELKRLRQNYSKFEVNDQKLFKLPLEMDAVEEKISLQDPCDQEKGKEEESNTKEKKSHRCIYCGKLYSRKYGLKIHIRTHTGYKPLKCKVCGRPFGDPSNLNKHVRLHAEGATPYRCEFCGKVLVRRRDLERHIKSRHPRHQMSQSTAPFPSQMSPTRLSEKFRHSTV